MIKILQRWISRTLVTLTVFCSAESVFAQLPNFEETNQEIPTLSPPQPPQPQPPQPQPSQPQPSQAPQPQPTFSPPQREQAYTLGAGDRLQIDILKVPQYSGAFDVLIDGSVNLPQIGRISVAGQTLEQAAQNIATQYESARILRRPRVTVSLVTARPLRIGIAGEVNRPGAYTLTPQGTRFSTVTEALQLAGGVTQSADLRQAVVRRDSNSGAEAEIAIDLWQVLQTGNLNNDLILRDGDVIFIPTAPQIDPVEGRQLASASFAAQQNQPLNIAILGEVRKPGTHTVTGEGGPGGFPTVTQALEAAGGIKPLADIRQIQVRRVTKTGLTQSIEIDLWQLLQEGDIEQDLILAEGDTIFIPTVSQIDLAEAELLRSVSFAPEDTQPLNITIIGEVFRPGPYTVTGGARTRQAGVPGSAGGASSVPTVTRAIQVAGGIKPLANVREVKIRRLTSTGAEQTIKVDLWELLQAGSPSQDPALQDGDTIFVPTAPEIDPDEIAVLAAASFSPDSINVNVVGEVQNPGVVRVPPNSPLSQVLLATGGFNQRAKRGDVQLIRLNPNGTVTQREVPVNFAQGIDEQNNPALQNNDVIIVGRSFFTGVSDTIETVLSPLEAVLRVFTFPFQFLQIFPTD